MRGDAGPRQVRDAEVGLTHNVGGSAPPVRFTSLGGRLNDPRRQRGGKRRRQHR